MKNRAFFVLFALGAFDVSHAVAGVSSLNTSTAIRPVSQYGLIQNVQDYSTNPFWNKNSLYNQTFPQPVYVTGPELNTSDCTSTVGALILSYCASNNNCVGMTISDVRPIIMLQLSRMPGHNYASSCSGFIDSEFESYRTKYTTSIPNTAVTFPGATVANPNYNETEFKIENPYQPKDATWQGEEWMKERRERFQELNELQSQNGMGNERIAKSDFPTTFADLSFTERMEVKKEGYEPYKDTSAYKPITVESEEAYQNRLKEVNHAAFCLRHPNDTACTGTSASANSSNINEQSDSGSQSNDGIIHLVLR